jgi:hypothetical protein
MQDKGTIAVECARRVLTARRASAYLLFGSLVLGGCGIGTLDKGYKGKKGPPSESAAQSGVVSDAYKKKMGSVTVLPRGGPGRGEPPKVKAPPSNPKGGLTTDSTAKRGYKARFAAFFMNRPGRRRAAEDEQTPIKLRGRYAMSDSGSYFVPCNDTTRYAVKGIYEAIYTMTERMRFIVRKANTPVYAVFTGTYVAAKPVAVANGGQAESKSSTPTAGQRSPAAAVPVARKTIFVNKVDSLTTSFPNACHPSNGNRSAG